MTVNINSDNGEGSANTINIMANIFISFIGAGVLGLPFAFREAGVLEGIFVMSLVGITSVKAMLLLIDCKYRLVQKSEHVSTQNHKMNNSEEITKLSIQSDEDDDEHLEMNGTTTQIEEPFLPPAPGQNLTYGDLGYYALGSFGRQMVDAAIVVSQIGFCCAYLIFIAENLSDYFPSLTMVHWLMIMLPPLCFLTTIRHLSNLALSSLFAQISNLMAFAVVFWFDFDHLSKIPHITPKEISLEGFPFFLAISMYCYEGAGMILALESSVASHKRPSFKKYFKITISIVTILYITFGVCGYLSFGESTDQIITLNLPKGFGVDFAMIVKSCLCLALFFTYPVMMFPVIQIIEKFLYDEPDKNIRQGNVLRVCAVILTGLIVLVIPNFSTLMALVGSTCCTMLAFFMPGLFHLKLFRNSLTSFDLGIDILLIFIGVVGAIVGTWDALLRMQDDSIAQFDTRSISDGDKIIFDNITSIKDTTSGILDNVLKNVLDKARNITNSSLTTLS